MKKYEVILQELKQRIQAGVYDAGLPSECRLAKEYAVAPLTARKALDVLAGDGIINRSPGKVARVNYEKLRPVKICLCCGREELDRITVILEREFPEMIFELENNPDLRLSNKYDITHIPTTFPDKYELHFFPFPRLVIQTLKETGALRHESLELHHVNGLYYGLPIVYSPTVLEVNCSLLKSLDLNLPARIGFKELKSCRDLLDTGGIDVALFDNNRFAELLMFQMLYDNIPSESTGLAENDWFGIYTRTLDEYIYLNTPDIGRGCDFSAGRALFRFVGRGFACEKLDFDTDYFAFGKGGGGFVHAFSESLVISRRAQEPERLIPICQTFLKPEIQRILGGCRRSIPVDKAAAYEAFCASPVEEQIFMREDQRCMFARPAHLRELNGTIWNAVPQYLRGQIDSGKLRKEILDHLCFLFKQETIIASFWQNQVSGRRELSLFTDNILTKQTMRVS